MFYQLVVPFFVLASLVYGSNYHERLLLRPLAGNGLLASFNFRSNTSAIAFEQQNFRHFPRSLGQILQHAHAKELHLRFTAGRWDAESWGTRPWSGSREGATGVELWAWVEAETDHEATTQWLALTNALSGLFCASLNFIDSTRTIRPVKTFEPEGVHLKSQLSKLQLLHGLLPHEVVCTENLTPFLKLLPCKGKAGISSLLDGHKLFDASWQVMALDVRPVCPSDHQSSCILEIEQTIDMVLDRERAKRPQDNPIPRPAPMYDIECDKSKPYHAEDTCYPMEKSPEPAWNLADIFGRHIRGSCLLADDSTGQEIPICVNTPPDRTVEVLTNPKGVDYGVITNRADSTICFHPPANGTEFSLNFPEQELTSKVPTTVPEIYASRFFTGYGQERGGIQAVLQNPSQTDSIQVIYLESLPWYMKPYLHTLRASLVPSTPFQPIRETFYRPALDRHRGTHLEIQLIIPPASSLTLTYAFDKAILRYTEYPPDANRGFDIAPAIIRVLPNDSTHAPDVDTYRRGVYVRTTSLLLPLPTPDFSMPYNVIILTSTVMALGFGGIFNILVRQFVDAEEVPPAQIGLLLATTLAKSKMLIRQVLARLTGSKEKVE